MQHKLCFINKKNINNVLFYLIVEIVKYCSVSVIIVSLHKNYLSAMSQFGFIFLVKEIIL